MDLYCATELELSYFGSGFLGGCFIGSFIMPRLADIYGRKPMFVLGLLIYTCVVVGTIFCKKLWLGSVLMFIGGISETGRYYVAYVYVVEFVPLRYQDKVGLAIFMAFGTVLTCIAL